MDAVFQALAHSGRREILDIVKNFPGCSVNDVCSRFETLPKANKTGMRKKKSSAKSSKSDNAGMSRIGVMKHLKVLEEARLIISRKQGRKRMLYFNVVPIQMVYDRWATEYSSFWASQVTDLKFRAEAKSEIESTDESQSDVAAKRKKKGTSPSTGKGPSTGKSPSSGKASSARKGPSARKAK